MQYPETSKLEQVRGALLPRLQVPGTAPGVPLTTGPVEIGLAIRTPVGPRAVRGTDLRAWGRTVEDLLDEAQENMRASTAAGGWQPVGPIEGLYTFLAADGLSASRLLNLRDFVSPWPDAGVLVAAPTPDQLFAVPLRDAESMHVMPILINAARAASHASSNPLTDQVFWFDGEALHHIPVVHTANSVKANPPQAFIDALEALSSTTVMGNIAEA